MADFVCAVRGGPGSYQTRLRALRLAARPDTTVHFVSVIDPAAYEPLHRGEQDAIRAELTWRDLAINEATATRAGLTEITYTVEIRVGDLVAAIAAYARERNAAGIIVGTPRRAADAQFADGSDEFVASLRLAAGVPVAAAPATADDGSELRFL